MTPHSSIDVHRPFGAKYCLHLQSRRYAKEATIKNKALFAVLFLIVSCVTYLNMEAVRSSETSFNYQTTPHQVLGNKKEALNFLFTSWSLFAQNISYPEDWTQFVPPKRRWTLTGLHSVPENKKASYSHLRLLVSCLTYSSTLKMEAICSSETWAVAELHGIITPITVLFIGTVICFVWRFETCRTLPLHLIAPFFSV
jgi:hypothetical protein